MSLFVFICLYLSVFVFICLYLSLFVFILSKFVKFWLSCLQNLYKSKSPISRSPQPVNDQNPGSWDLRWKPGTYMGPSLDVLGGHVIRLDDGSYTTTKHVRPNLVDPNKLVDFGHYEAVIPVPTKRYRRKTDVEAEQMDSDEEVVPPYDPNHPAEHYAMGLLEEEVLIPDQLETLVHLLPPTAQVPRRFGEQGSEKKLWSAGAFVHGGVLGVKKATTSFPMSTMVFNKYVNQISPGFKFNAIAVNVDILTKEHKDVHNVGKSLWWRTGC